MKPNDQAFPLIVDDGSTVTVVPGLPIRAYLAAKAMQGYISDFSGPDVRMPDPSCVARESVLYADALILALNEK